MTQEMLEGLDVAEIDRSPRLPGEVIPVTKSLDHYLYRPTVVEWHSLKSQVQDLQKQVKSLQATHSNFQQCQDKVEHRRLLQVSSDCHTANSTVDFIHFVG